MSDIYYIATKLDKNWAKTFKQLGNQVKALTKIKYIEHVLPNIQNYFVTIKADGLRCFLIINTNYIKYVTALGDNYMQIANTFVSEYIFDCEYINDKIYIFDVIVNNNVNVANMTFALRHKILVEFQNILVDKKLTQFIEVKQFLQLTVANYQRNIHTMQYNKKKYNTDGLIFVSVNENYNNTINLKWKPTTFLTIDFLAVKVSVNNYILCVGIKSSLLKNFNIVIDNKFIKLLNTLQPVTNTNYVPVPFYNSLVPNIYYYTHNNNTNLHGCIIELSLTKDMQWLFHRVRYDRQTELQSGTYYGNNYNVAEQTLATIINPLTIKDLLAPYQVLVSNVYFTKQDTAYKSVKFINNYIKNLLISRYKNNNYVIDIASGRGGDLKKYANANVANLLMLEIDTNAIEEVIDRKYNILTNNSCLNLIILQMNLNNNYKKNISILQKNCCNTYVNCDNIIGSSSSVIFCHFAAHYLLQTAKLAQNIISFVSHYLQHNGNFIVTIFDGQKVFNLLQQHNGIWQTDKYMIKYQGKQPSIFSGFGHEIQILLPFSNTPYTESLIDLYTLDTLFKKNKMYRTEEKNFIDLIQNTQHNILNANDQLFVGLYKYVIYTKR